MSRFTASFVGLFLLYACAISHIEAAVLFGSYSPSKTITSAINTWLGVNQSVVITEIGWQPQSDIIKEIASVQAIWEQNAVPIVTWMPYPYANWAGPTPNNDIANGMYDDYINPFLANLTQFLQGTDGRFGTSDDRRAYVRIAPQPNGDWFPWSPYCPPCGSTGQKIKQTPQSYIDMFQYLVNAIRVNYSMPSDAVQIIWNVNDVDASAPFEQFYPGDAFVDWTAVVAFNWGSSLPGNSWQSPRQLLAGPMARLRALAPKKPVALLTIASTSNPKGVTSKGNWLKRLATFVSENLDVVKMLAFHNADAQTDLAFFGGKKGETVFQGYNVYPEVQNAINANGFFIPSSATDPKLITSMAFMGSNHTPTLPPGTTLPPPPPPPPTPAPGPTPAPTYDPNCPCDTAQTRQALTQLYTMTNGDQWAYKSDWLSSAPICSWYGVGCPASNPFLSLILDDNNLKGSIPSWEGLNEFLPLMQYFDLDNNQLSGTLHASYAGMTNLQSLFLYTLQLTGTIPDAWAALGNLTNLQLDNNQLHGTLPNWIANLTQLEYLTFDNNYFTGPMPTSWCSLVMIDGVTLCDGQDAPESNKFCGPEPSCWSGNTALDTAYSSCVMCNAGKPLPWC